MQRATIHPTVAAVALGICATACVYSPESGGEFSPDEVIRFRGLASQPGATVQLLGFNRYSGAWESLDETTAMQTPNEFHDDQRLYQWRIELRLADREHWRCLASPSCEVAGDGEEIRFAVREVDGTVERLFTYDLGGFECWWDRYRAGADLLSAYWPCRAEDFHEIRLRVEQD